MNDNPSSGDHAWAAANKVGADLQRLENRVAAMELERSGNKVSVDGQDLVAAVNALIAADDARLLRGLNIREDIRVVCDRLLASVWRPGANG